jgi:hypothetical protein
VVWAAIQRAAADASAEAPDPAAGVVALAREYARGDTPDRVPVELLVTVPLATLAGSSDEPAELADGSFASAETARRLACDAGIVLAAVGPSGEPLAVGRKTRTIPAALRRALLLRDRTCRFPGCSNSRFVEGHHLRHWADGGETSLRNTTLLCSGCHASVHALGVRIELDPDGQPVFFDARGDQVHAVPPRPQPARLGRAAIEAANAHKGISPTTGRCQWDGSRPDYGAAVAGLWSTQRPDRLDDDDDDELAAERALSERHARQLADREREVLDLWDRGELPDPGPFPAPR